MLTVVARCVVTGVDTPSYRVEASTRYTYDTLGNLTQVRDALSNTTVMTYNVLSQKTVMLDPDMGRGVTNMTRQGI